jgi:MFS family permease
MPPDSSGATLTRSSLWSHPEFLKLWAGETVSLAGSQITLIALPLTAVLTLGASAGQMGALGAAQYAPIIVFGLFAGALVDRLPRRRVLIGSSLGSAVALGSIPLLAALDVLRIEHLYVASFFAGACAVLFGLAYVAFVSALVHQQQLVDANSKLEISGSLARVAGPGLAGALVQLVTAPIAVAVDSLTFVVSAFAIYLTRAEERVARRHRRAGGVLSEIRDGLRVILSNPVLCALAATAGTTNLCAGALATVYVLFVTRDLGIQPGMLGVLFSAGSAGSVLGAVAVARVTQRFGLGRTMGAVILIEGLATLLVPLAGIALAATIPLLLTARFVVGLTVPIFNVNLVSMRQAATPDELQGRANASSRFISGALLPVGAVAGGALGERVGLPTTLTLAALGIMLSSLWIFLSPVRAVRASPALTQKG